MWAWFHAAIRHREVQTVVPARDRCVCDATTLPDGTLNGSQNCCQATGCIFYLGFRPKATPSHDSTLCDFLSFSCRWLGTSFRLLRLLTETQARCMFAVARPYLE